MCLQAKEYPTAKQRSSAGAVEEGVFGAGVKRLLLRLKQKEEVCDFNSPVPNKGGIFQGLVS